MKPVSANLGLLGMRGAERVHLTSVAGPEAALILKPENLTFEQAACVPVAGLTALQGLRDKGGLKPGQKVLINGAAGGIGTFAHLSGTVPALGAAIGA
jgi:NADPH:quinone reductase-like Zn-dependent oxidoreductase